MNKDRGFVQNDRVYSFIKRNMPIFCIDIVTEYRNKVILLLRDREPMANTFWLPGGRVRHGEAFLDSINRILSNELNIEKDIRSCDLISFKNYIIKDSQLKDVHHTPALTFLVKLNNEILPSPGSNHSSMYLSDILPYQFWEDQIYFSEKMKNKMYQYK